MDRRAAWSVLLTAFLSLALSQNLTAQPPPLTLIVHTIDPACNASSGAIFLSATGGTPPYSYSFRGIPTGTQSDLTGLGPGIIPVAVTDADGNTATQTVTLTQKINPPQVTVSAFTDPTRCGLEDGTISLSASGGKAPYTYSLDMVSWQTSAAFANLPSNPPSEKYTMWVQDANGCRSFAPNVPILASNCAMRIWSYAYNSLIYGCGIKTSYIHINGVSGGNAPLMYSLDGINYQTSGNFDNLGAGFYRVHVKDATGVELIQAFQIADECQLTATYTTTDAGCAHNDATITVNASNFTPPYRYSLDGVNYQSSNLFTGLTAGTYSITVRELYGYTTTILATVFDDCPLVTAKSTGETCGAGNGTITANGSNGTAPYQYSLDGTSYQTSPLFSNLSSGNYTIYIKDVRNNTSSTPVSVSNNCLQASATSTSSTCGNANGSITAAATNGTQPYQYSIDGTTFQSSPLFDKLPPGNYTITVKDVSNTTATTTTTITDIAGPSSLNLTIIPSSCIVANGSVLLIVSGGTAPYTYSIDGTNFTNNLNFDNLAGGATLTAIAKDANGCTITQNSTMTTRTPPTIISLGTTPATCLNNDGAVMLSSYSGYGPFKSSLDGSHYVTQDFYYNLPSGQVTVYLQDSYGCTTSQTTTIALNNDLTVDAGPDQTICEGKSIQLNASSNGTTFTWSPSANLNNASTLAPAAAPQTTTQYTLTASRGVCNSSAGMTIFVNPAPTADAGINIATCYGKAVQLSGSGASQAYWLPASALDDPHSLTPTFQSPAQTTTFRLTVTDANGCSSLNTAQVTVTVTPPAKVFAGNDTSIMTGQSLQLNAVDINNSGFTSYTWSPDEGLSDPIIQNPVAHPTGNIVYQVLASTPDGCSGIGSRSVKVYAVSDIFVPNGFTPNGDGHNDILRAIAIGIRDFRYLSIYNRYGQLVFQTQDPARGWDGMINGQPQSAGTFIWMAAGVDYTGRLVQRKGTVILIR